MRFVETPLFTAEVCGLLSDDEYRDLQLALRLRPEAGSLIRGGSGLRKLRWRRPGHGKRGGLRLIYYWYPREDLIYMLMVFRKTAQEDLTPRQLRILRQLVEEYLE